MQNNRPLQVGIVFSGGMAKGSYEIGVMKAFQKQKLLQVAGISAASIGTLNAYAWLCEKLSDAEQIWQNIYAETKGKTYRTLIKNRGIYNYIEVLRKNFCKFNNSDKKRYCERLEKQPLNFFTVYNKYRNLSSFFNSQSAEMERSGMEAD